MVIVSPPSSPGQEQEPHSPPQPSEANDIYLLSKSSRKKPYKPPLIPILVIVSPPSSLGQEQEPHLPPQPSEAYKKRYQFCSPPSPKHKHKQNSPPPLSLEDKHWHNQHPHHKHHYAPPSGHKHPHHLAPSRKQN
ncbi:hypothetical protein TanjilG_30498 [Lupinus angustifolius]|uniref:Uncharacterized protein n=1 Tax=Lupinus angustifolius TaxID=3871 RepID=A0A394DDE7_LUPAN|nr:hypothetical protein TanjilG_30498 [Lupinus angustifolius]